MALAQIDPRNGPRVAGPLVTLTATNTVGTLYVLPIAAGQNAVTAILRKLHIFSSDSAACNLSIGNGTPFGTFVASRPKFNVLAGFDIELSEDQLVAVEDATNITCAVDAHTAGSVVVQGEFELIPASTVHA